MEPNSLNDNKSLISRLQTGDGLGFQEIYYRHQPKIYAIAFLKTHSREISEEIVQDLFVELWANRTKLDIKGPLENYLYVSLRYKIFNFYKSSRIRSRYCAVCKLKEEACANFTEQSIQYSEMNSLVQEGLKKIPLKSRRIFTMSRFGNLTNKQIGSTLNLSEKTIEYHISKSIKVLRLFLKDYL